MAIPEWTAAMGAIDDAHAHYNDFVFNYREIPNGDQTLRTLNPVNNVPDSVKDGHPSDEFRLLTGGDAAELESQIRASGMMGPGDELLSYNGAVILRHPKYTDLCSDSDSAQTNRQFPMSPEAIRAVAYFSQKRADSSWCLLPAEPGTESTLPQVFTPWDLSNQAQLAEFKDVVLKIREAQGVKVDPSLNRERAGSLARAVSTEELDRILGEIQGKQHSNQNAIDRFFSQPWYKRWLDIGEAAGVFTVIGWVLHRLLDRIFPPRPPSPPTSPTAQPRPIPAPEKSPVSAPEGTSERTAETSTARALGAMTAGLLAVLLLRRGGVRETEVRKGASRYVEIRVRPSLFRPLFEPALQPVPVRGSAGSGFHAFEAAFGTP